MRIPVTILEEIDITRLSQLSLVELNVFADLVVSWKKGVPYRVYQQSFKQSFKEIR